MMHTHSLAEWVAFLSLGVSFWSACAAVIWLTADAELTDFDPRPAVRRALNTDAGAQLVVAVFNAKADARDAVAEARQYAALSLRQAAVSVAALLALLLPAAGGTR